MGKVNKWLLPAAWLYGAVIAVRNKFFDWHWLTSKSYPVPVICVGNLSVGGTGKTPHTEYLIRLLANEGLQIATLSRGYKRKSHGFLLSDSHSTAIEIGDEPYQMKHKFPNMLVAVDEDRCHGIEMILQVHPLFPDQKSWNTAIPDVILLDDAFQHRYVKPGLSILLTDYHRLFSQDALLPAGRLREPASGKARAQMVIVTKCPLSLSSIERDKIRQDLDLLPYQQLYFSTFKYGKLQPLVPSETTGLCTVLESCCNDKSPKSSTMKAEEMTLNGKSVLIVSGIASPAPLVDYVEQTAAKVILLAFGDHHDFTIEDMEQIEKSYQNLPAGERVLVTTEKDAARLRCHPRLKESLKKEIFILPIEVEILGNQQDTFNQNIIKYVRTHSRNSSLPER